MKKRWFGVQSFYVMILFMFIAGAGLQFGALAAWWTACAMFVGAQIWSYEEPRDDTARDSYADL